MKNIIDKGVANDEFYRFLEAHDIADESGLGGDELEDFEGLKCNIVKLIVGGKIAVNEDGEPTLNIGNDEVLTFSEPTGASLIGSRKGGADEMTKLYRIMSEMTGTSPQKFAKMKMRHLKPAINITKLFLA